MDKQIASIEDNGTWDIVPRSSVKPGTPIIPCKWVFKNKTDENGVLTERKARLCPKGFVCRIGSWCVCVDE